LKRACGVENEVCRESDAEQECKPAVAGGGDGAEAWHRLRLFPVEQRRAYCAA